MNVFVQHSSDARLIITPFSMFVKVIVDVPSTISIPQVLNSSTDNLMTAQCVKTSLSTKMGGFAHSFFRTDVLFGQHTILYSD